MAFFSFKKSRKFKNKKKKSLPLLSVSTQNFIAHRLTDIKGISFIFSGIILAMMLLSFNPKDPSFNTSSSSKEIHNLFGHFGSYISDILLQTIGLASYIFVIAFLVWGYRVIKRKPVTNLRIKIAVLSIAAINAAITLARIPSFESWEMGSYMGGSAGSLLLTNLSNPLQNIIGAESFMFVAVVSAFIFIISYMIVLGLSLENIIGFLGKAKNIIISSYFLTSNAIRKFNLWHKYYSKDDLIIQGNSKTIRQSQEKKSSKPYNSKNSQPKPIVNILSRKKKKENENRQKELKFMMSDDDWDLPSIDLLDEHSNINKQKHDASSLEKNAVLLQSTLRDFGVEGEILKVNPGPIVTLYEMEPSPGTKTSRVIGLSDDIARSMSAVSVRVAVVPGKNAIGLELPNRKRETVFLKEILSSDDYGKTKCHLPLALGKDIGGETVIVDLARMPHLLVAGTTGSGKSVAINTMILSLIYKLSPEQCRFIMIDPKMLELSVYDDIPHLLTPVVTEAHKAVTSLKWAVREMEDRYRAMSKLGVRNIDSFNERIRESLKKGEVLMHKVQTGFDIESGKPIFEEQPISQVELPYIVIIVDEFADLMLVAGKEVEKSIQRLAQMARAAGIHLIMATQRPSVDVITGVVKSNFPTRISFQVTSKIDSRTILGEGGAEQLLGQGDMLYMASGGRLKRVHGPFVTDEEVEKIVKHLRAQGTPKYVDGVTVDVEDNDSEQSGAGKRGGYDELYDEAVAIIMREQKVSTSFIQRHLQIGYNRAARIIECMEKDGLISAASGSGKREILVDNYGT